jgi:hypothetical protein
VSTYQWGQFEDVLGIKLQARNADRIARLQGLAALAEHEMKLLAPWRNITGAARQRLHARVIVTPSWPPPRRAVRVEVRWFLAQGVPYGRFLEHRWGGKWAIVGPTAQRYRVRVKQALRAGPIPRARHVLSAGPIFLGPQSHGPEYGHVR